MRHNRPLLPVLLEQGALAINLLPSGDLDLARALARPAEKRFDGVALEQGGLGLPILATGPGALCCRMS